MLPWKIFENLDTGTVVAILAIFKQFLRQILASFCCPLL